MIEYVFEKDLETTIKKVRELITGAYALAIIDRENPDQIIAIKLGSPLVVGIAGNDLFLSSDANALSNITEKYIPIDDNEMVIIDKNTYKIISSGTEIEKNSFESLKSNVNEDINVILTSLEKYSKLNFVDEIQNPSGNVAIGLNNLSNIINQMLQENKSNGLVLEESSRVLLDNVNLLNKSSNEIYYTMQDAKEVIE